MGGPFEKNRSFGQFALLKERGSLPPRIHVMMQCFSIEKMS